MCYSFQPSVFFQIAAFFMDPIVGIDAKPTSFFPVLSFHWLIIKSFPFALGKVYFANP